MDFDWREIKNGAKYLFTHDWDDNIFYQLGGDFANLLFSKMDT